MLYVYDSSTNTGRTLPSIKSRDLLVQQTDSKTMFTQPCIISGLYLQTFLEFSDHELNDQHNCQSERTVMVCRAGKDSIFP